MKYFEEMRKLDREIGTPSLGGFIARTIYYVWAKIMGRTGL